MAQTPAELALQLCSGPSTPEVECAASRHNATLPTFEYSRMPFRCQKPLRLLTCSGKYSGVAVL